MDKPLSETLEYLKTLKPGLLPLELFYELCRLVTISSYEVVPFCKIDGDHKVLLVRRETDDPYWPGLWHTTGTVIRPTDTLESAKNRLFSLELDNPEVLVEPVFMGNLVGKEKRGNSVGIYHYAVVEKTSIGECFGVDNLPSDIVTYQVQMIKKAYNSVIKASAV